MVDDKNIEAISKRYLLGDLAEEDAARLEEKYFADDSAFEVMALAEDEIIDAYVRDELSPEDRRRFEENFLSSPRISQRIELAKILKAKASSRRVSHDDVPVLHGPAVDQKQASNREKGSRWWKNVWQPFRQPAFASLVLVLIGAGILGVEWYRVREESKQLLASRAELERQNRDLIADNNKRALETDQLIEALKTKEAENAKLNEQLEQASNKPALTLPVIPILLPLAGSRGEGIDQTVKLPEEPSIFKLKIPLEEAKYERYSVIIKTPEDRVVSGPREARAQGRILIVQLASTRFIPGDYIVTVSGVSSLGKRDEIEDYTLRIIRSKTR